MIDGLEPAISFLAKMLEAVFMLPFPARGERPAQVSDGAAVTKAADVRKMLAQVKPGARLRPVKIVRGWELSYGLVAAFMLLNILVQIQDRSCQYGMAWAWNGQIFLLAIDVVALVLICIATRSSLMVSVEGIEMQSWFVRRQYRFLDMLGGFDLVQRKISPGFDIVFRVRDSSTADTPIKTVRLIKFADMTDAELLEFLDFYKGKS